MSEGNRLEFYSSPQWKKCRSAYKKSVGGLCERCREKGLIVPGEMVHHKIHLNSVNMYDPDVALNFENLELLCRDCHAAEHGPTRRYKVDEYGRVVGV